MAETAAERQRKYIDRLDAAGKVLMRAVVSKETAESLRQAAFDEVASVGDIIDSLVQGFLRQQQPLEKSDPVAAPSSTKRAPVLPKLPARLPATADLPDKFVPKSRLGEYFGFWDARLDALLLNFGLAERIRQAVPRRGEIWRMHATAAAIAAGAAVAVSPGGFPLWSPRRVAEFARRRAEGR